MNAYAAVKWIWLVFCGVWLLAAFVQKRNLRRQSAVSRLLQLGIIAVALAPFYIVNGGAGILRRQLFPTPPVMQGIGVLVMLLGFAFAVWARVALGGNWSGIVTVKENHTLITRGPYEWVRHPIYTGILLLLLGTAIVVGRLVNVMELGVVALGFWLKLRMEEQFMLETFGEQYAAYRQRVKALIPGVL